MRDISIIAFVLSLPLLAVLGHDFYLAYTNVELEGVERFYPSDLGWLWVQYSPGTYNWMVENTDTVLWSGIILPLLQSSAVIVAAIPLIIYLGVVIIMKLFGLGSFEGQGLLQFGAPGRGGKKKDFSFSGKETKKKAKYKRK